MSKALQFALRVLIGTMPLSCKSLPQGNRLAATPIVTAERLSPIAWPTARAGRESHPFLPRVQDRVENWTSQLYVKNFSRGGSSIGGDDGHEFASYSVALRLAPPQATRGFEVMLLMEGRVGTNLLGFHDRVSHQVVMDASSNLVGGAELVPRPVVYVEPPRLQEPAQPGEIQEEHFTYIGEPGGTFRVEVPLGRIEAVAPPDGQPRYSGFVELRVGRVQGEAFVEDRNWAGEGLRIWWEIGMNGQAPREQRFEQVKIEIAEMARYEMNLPERVDAVSSGEAVPAPVPFLLVGSSTYATNAPQGYYENPFPRLNAANVISIDQ